MRRCIAWALLLVSWACLAGAHTMTLTEVTVTLVTPGKLDVKIGIDLTQILGSPDRYYQFVTEPEAVQRAQVRTLLPQVLGGLQLVIGNTPLPLELKQFSTA